MRAPDELRALVEEGLARLTPTASLDGLCEAMRYALYRESVAFLKAGDEAEAA